MLEEACTANIWTNAPKFCFFLQQILTSCVKALGVSPARIFWFVWIWRNLSSGFQEASRVVVGALSAARDSNPEFASCWRQLKAPASHTPVNPLPTSKLLILAILTFTLLCSHYQIWILFACWKYSNPALITFMSWKVNVECKCLNLRWNMPFWISGCLNVFSNGRFLDPFPAVLSQFWPVTCAKSFPNTQN